MHTESKIIIKHQRPAKLTACCVHESIMIIGVINAYGELDNYQASEACKAYSMLCS